MKRKCRGVIGKKYLKERPNCARKNKKYCKNVGTGLVPAWQNKL